MLASEKEKQCARRYYLKNKERILARMKENYEQNKETMNASRKKNYYKNKEKKNRDSREYYQKNKVALKQYQLAYRRGRIKTDTSYHLGVVLRTRLYLALKNNQKTGSAVHDLGCTVPELKLYLEGQFKDGMTWDNWSMTGWHVDHKIPLAFFDLTNREQFLQAVHYTNLQPLWATENIAKGKKLQTV